VGASHHRCDRQSEAPANLVVDGGMRTSYRWSYATICVALVVPVRHVRLALTRTLAPSLIEPRMSQTQRQQEEPLLLTSADPPCLRRHGLRTWNAPLPASL
jgi:hypothetical protein